VAFFVLVIFLRYLRQALVTDLLAAKMEWFENTSSDATKDEVQSVKQDMENTLAPIFARLAEPG